MKYINKPLVFSEIVLDIFSHFTALTKKYHVESVEEFTNRQNNEIF